MVDLYLYMSGYGCSSFGQLYDCIRNNRHSNVISGYSLLGLDDKVY